MIIEPTLYDIAQLLESADGADGRVRRVLELLRVLVPYDQCALLETRPGHEPRVVLVPDASLDGGAPPLLRTLLDLFSQLVDIPAGALAAPLRTEENHLAVPLVGLDQVIGLLFVRSAAGYTEQHLRGLSVVAAKLAAYFTMLRDRTDLTDLARERDQALHAVEAAGRAKDAVLHLLLQELKARLDGVLASGRVLRASLDDARERPRAIDQLEHSLEAQAALVQEIIDRRFGAPAEPRPGDVDLPRLPEGGARSGRLAGIRVLLVEHDLGVREAIESALDHQGAEITAVSTVAEALAMLEGGWPDVMLFGDLPARGDGVDELMRAVTARACPLPVASISTRGLDDRHHAQALGFQLHLAKPIGVEALVDAVAELAGRTTANSPRNLERGSRS